MNLERRISRRSALRDIPAVITGALVSQQATEVEAAPNRIDQMIRLTDEQTPLPPEGYISTLTIVTGVSKDSEGHKASDFKIIGPTIEPLTGPLELSASVQDFTLFDDADHQTFSQDIPNVTPIMPES